MAFDQSLLRTMEWRCIGPPRGGRVVAVTGDPADPMTFYFGACAGGVWKSDDGGAYWQNVSDGYFKTAAVGAIAVAESDPNVVYAGMGESCIRTDVSHGDGVYRSSDAAAPGRISACKTPGTSPGSVSTQPTPTWSTSPPSATPGAPTPTAASSAPPTVGNPGSTSFTRTTPPALQTFPSTPTTPG